MELKPRYKLSEVGVIPDDWDARALGCVGEALIGLTYRPENVRSHGILVLRASNIQNDKLTFEDNVYVDIDIPERIMVRPGDVLVCVRNGSRQLIGKSALIDRQCIGMTFGAFMAVHRGSDGPLVNYCFQSEILKRQINEHLGATINQITNRSLNAFRIPYPPTDAERQHISGALSDADALVDGLDRLIAKKRDLKQAAMQQLLTGQTRLPGFSGTWETKRLGDIGQFLKGRGIRKEELLPDGLPCVRYGELYTHHNDHIRAFYSFISPKTATASLPIQEGDLLFAGSGETAEEIGKCAAYLFDQEAYAGGDIVIMRPVAQSSEYLGYLMNQPIVAAQKARMGQGDAVVHISAKNLAAVQVRLPSLPEQSAIATVLSDMDAEISALERRRDKTRFLKQAIMQELLTGKTRLVLPHASPEVANA